ncbi:ATP-dependent Zn protease [Enterococcus termitis]|nr:ATP-dependent Zn protease [Enterococcus termitis]
MKKLGFDPQKYIEEQSKYILERVDHYDKLYLEFGGKLIGDMHAKRVLPGFDADAKIKLLQKLKDQAEILICVYAGDIERNKIRGDYGITYDMDILRQIDELREYGLAVNSVVITRYSGQPSTKMFINKLERRDIKVYKHAAIEDYPSNLEKIVSEEGFGKNEYIPTTKPIVVVTAPGPGSGKLATCLNQLYHESRNGKTAGYSKFETFPVWNVPLKHPLNIAYEAATVDLKDVNMIDSFHFDKYQEVVVNYNRDVETFPVIKRIIEKITGEESVYQSPTDMGVNRVGFGIIDDDVVKEASKQEIIRRCFATECDFKKGLIDEETVNRIKLIMEEVELKKEDRKAVLPAREYSERLREQTQSNDTPAVIAFELQDGRIVTGRTSSLMDSCSSAILNSIKTLANISDEILLLSPVILETIQTMKRKDLHSKITALKANEILIALAISAVTNPTAQLAYDKLSELNGVQAHSTVMLSKNDEQTLRELGLDITSDAVYPSENLYYI